MRYRQHNEKSRKEHDGPQNTTKKTLSNMNPTKNGMCSSGVTCLPADCLNSKANILKSNQACWYGTKQTSFLDM